MADPTRTDLEEAARRYFAELGQVILQPRDYHPIYADEQVHLNMEMFQQRIDDLDMQFRAATFDREIDFAARELAAEAQFELDDLPDELRRYALNLSARVAREHCVRMVEFLKQPTKPFEPNDALLIPTIVHSSRQRQNPPTFEAIEDIRFRRAGPTLLQMGQKYLDKKIAQGVGPSLLEELARALRWLRERVGDDLCLADLSKPDMRMFRDDLQRLKGGLQGRTLPFDQRLTDDPEKRAKSVTTRRYWTSIYSFLEWAAAEGHIPSNPAEGLKLDLNKTEQRESPEAFTTGELIKLFRTPLFAGYQSPSRVGLAGDCQIRDGRWWSALILLHTGMRAGELAQLLTSDFVFLAETPHFKIRLEDETGKRVKSAKNKSAIRDVPIAPVLLVLGLKEFIVRRAKIAPGKRVFFEFNLGVNGRTSDGLTKFWGRYLKSVDLWKPHRATHVWRHTIISFLRDNDVAQEDIAALVGHSQGTMTASYGGDYSLGRKAKTLNKLDIGFDVIEAAGGPYDAKLHA